MEMIVCSQVHFSYFTGAGEVEVLRGLDMLVEQGEHVAIVGPSGTGKSTLLRLIAALDWPGSGDSGAGALPARAGGSGVSAVFASACAECTGECDAAFAALLSS